MIRVRKAKLKDIDLVLYFENELLKSAMNIMKKYTPQDINDWALKKDYNDILLKYIKGRIFSKNDAIFISEFDGKPVGHMIVSIKKNFPIFDMLYYGRINTIYVKEEYRGNRISSKLKDEAFKWFKSKGIKRVSLNVFPDNKHAIDAYQKWGLTLSLLEMRSTI